MAMLVITCDSADL